MSRLTLFAKGNLDIRDSLHSLRIGRSVVWNGVNEVVRIRFPGTLIRLRHELCTRSDALCEARGVVPASLAEHPLPLAPYGPEVQFSQALFEAGADAIILSILSDVAGNLLRHRAENYLLCPHNLDSWVAADRAWLKDAFVRVPLLDVEDSMHNFCKIVARIRHRSDVPILVYNVSSIIPGEWVHCHTGLEDLLSTRIRRFNLALIELSRQTGISIIDVDAICARAGARRLKIDAVHLNAEGCRLIAEEVVRVLEDLGCFAKKG